MRENLIALPSDPDFDQMPELIRGVLRVSGGSGDFVPDFLAEALAQAVDGDLQGGW